MILHPPLSFFFFFNDTATTEIYTLSLHDALPISLGFQFAFPPRNHRAGQAITNDVHRRPRHINQRVNAEKDRKSTRLNSSHTVISYAVFCLKKKKNKIKEQL